MQISNPIKILVGLGTLWYALYPLLSIVVWLLMISSVFLPISFEQSEPPFFMLPFFVIFPLHLFTILLGFVLMTFYLVHVIKNRRGSETIRIILGVGCFFMPFIAMPIYYFVFVWRDELPAGQRTFRIHNSWDLPHWQTNSRPARLRAPTSLHQPWRSCAELRINLGA